jgi:RNA polymerase sigma-70 factor (ECF subfamily)
MSFGFLASSTVHRRGDLRMETRTTLIGRVRDTGDAESWREFVEIYGPLIMAYARKGLEPEAALDVVQEVFIRLLKALPRFEFDRRRGKFRTWLWQITQGAIVDSIRRNQTRVKAEVGWVELQSRRDPPEDFVTMTRRRVLEYALGKVAQAEKPRAWECFSRHVLHRRPAAEVGAELGISVNHVSVICSRVRSKVRSVCIEAMGEFVEDLDSMNSSDDPRG